MLAQFLYHPHVDPHVKECAGLLRCIGGRACREAAGTDYETFSSAGQIDTREFLAGVRDTGRASGSGEVGSSDRPTGC